MTSVTELSGYLLKQWKQGNHDSVTELFDRYEARLVGLVRARISGQYLAAIARNKVAKQIEHHSAQKRNPNRELVTTDELMRSPEFIDREPGADEEVALMDELEQLMMPMTAIQRLMLVQRLEGISVEQIAKDIDHAEEFVRDFLKKTRVDLEARLNSFL
jgi:DNA-directed RNA polymerase specialized sigma24 family protein